MPNFNFGTSRGDPSVDTDLAESCTKFVGTLEYDAHSP